MKKSVFCILLALCLCLSFSTVAYANGAIGSIDADDTVTDPIKGTLEMTSSPSGAVAIAKNLQTGSTYYYRVNGDILANNPTVSRETNGMIPAEVAYQFGETASPNQIINGDDRIKVTDTSALPYSAIAFVKSTFIHPITGATITSFGTAWMISPDTAATAAHVIYDEDCGWATSVTVIPGLCVTPPIFNMIPIEFMGPYGYSNATEIAVSTQWKDNKSDYHDWGVIRLSESIGNNSGYLGFKYCSYNLVPSNLAPGEELRSVMISGYPGDRNNLTDDSDGITWNNEYFQYVSSGYIVGDITENISIPTYRRIEHRADTSNGQSGSPLIYEGQSIGIHTTPIDGAIENEAVGISSQLFSFLLAYR